MKVNFQKCPVTVAGNRVKVKEGEWMWKPIRNYEGLYMVSSTGRILSCERKGSDGRVLKEKSLNGGQYSNGYKFVCLRKDGKNKNCSIHRLVADAFIPNPSRLPVVNHKDGNINNNCTDNLEWCTQGSNLEHAVEIGLVESQCKIRRKVTVKHGEHIILFDTMKDCAAFFGFKKGWLHNQIRKHGCTFNYSKYNIEVHGRGIDK